MSSFEAPTSPKLVNVITGGRDVPRQCRSYTGNVTRVPTVPEYSEDLTFSPQDFKGVPRNVDDSIVISAVILEYEVRRILVDTGSSADVMFWDCFQKLGIPEDQLQPCHFPLIGFTGHQATVAGRVVVAMTVGDSDARSRQIFPEFLVVRTTSAYNIILGRPSLVNLKAAVSPYYQCIKFPTPRGEGRAQSNPEIARNCYVLSNTRHLAQQTLSIETSSLTEQLLPSPEPQLKATPCAAPFKKATSVTAPSENTIPNTDGCHSSPAEPVIRVPLNDADPTRTVQIGASLPPEQRDPLIQFLQANADVFAWEPADMPGISRATAVHRLKVDSKAKPVKQKKRGIAGERNDAAEAEVKKLLAAGFIQEIDYPEWLSNIVMVKKANGKWRMCVDYTDLNRACPKDCFPLPDIDQLVDRVSGHGMLSLMDAYSGYNQIKMSRKDKAKTAFITNSGTYCYRVMPFGLKNAGATYQRLMMRLFKDQIGRNVEVYVDDMLVKSEQAINHVNDLTETFAVLRQHQMKLNPEKCTFGVTSGKFLGFMISPRGIEANPDKTEAIANIQEPRTLKDVQRLAGQLAALSRFLSRHAEKSLPFFRILRGVHHKGQITWTDEHRAALQQLKDRITSLPRLSKPQPGERLYLYLAAGDEAIGSVLVRVEGDREYPVYYVSKILHGAEQRYSHLEKVAFAAYTTAKRLRPYFTAHPITVYSDQPLGRFLVRPENAGRMALWAVHMSQHTIDYLPRPAIKAQVLADFIAENTSSSPASEDMVTNLPLPSTTPRWNVYVDGASNKSGAGIGIVIKGPQNTVLRYAIKLAFDATNNVAEYEALLAGMDLAATAGARDVNIFSDSQLVVNQMNDGFEAREDAISKYCELAKVRARNFNACETFQLSRDDNEEADSLAKLAASPEMNIDNSDIMVDVKELPSIVEGPRLLQIDQTPSWMDPYVQYLKTGNLPDDPALADKIKRKAPQYVMDGDLLYRWSYTRVKNGPMLRCLRQDEAESTLREIHEGPCGNHLGARALIRKVHQQGYFWPTLIKDAVAYVKTCDACQRHAPVSHLPASEQTAIICPIPFAQWGMDILGPFPKASGGRKYLLVLIDYFTKWVECEPLKNIKTPNVINVLLHNIVYRFGMPKAIITDHGKQFTSDAFKAWCADNEIQLRLSAIGYPECNGQAEVTNRTIKNHLECRVTATGSSWVDELPHVLWAYRTTYRTPTGDTPFSLTYGADALVPSEVLIPTYRNLHFHTDSNDTAMRSNLDLLEERRDDALHSMTIHRQRAVRHHNSKVKARAFQVGDLVLRLSSVTPKRESQGKLAPKWEGPYRVRAIIRPGTYALQWLSGRDMPHAWNVKYLKKYYQ